MVGAQAAMQHQHNRLFPHGGAIGHEARALDIEEQPHTVYEHMHEPISRGRTSR
jgi:hypothetical protein